MKNIELLYKEGFYPLFQVLIIHDYYLKKYNIGTSGQLIPDLEAQDRLRANYNVQDFFNIKPTKECEQLLRNHHALFRLVPGGFMVLIWVEQNNTPKVPLTDDTTFDFLITLKEPLFYNFSNLPLNDPKLEQDGVEEYRAIYKFDNEKLNVNNLSLTSIPSRASIEDRISSKDYPVESESMGLIRIKTRIGNNANYNLLDINNSLISPNFFIKFEARKTIWKFYKQTDLSTPYFTTTALPFSKGGISPITSTTGIQEDLPNPNGRILDYNPDPIVLNYPTSTDVTSIIYL